MSVFFLTVIKSTFTVTIYVNIINFIHMDTVSLSSWGDAIRVSLLNIVTDIVNFIPQLIMAIIVLIIGIVVARVLGRIVERIISYTRINQVFYRTGVASDLARVGVNLNIGYVFGWLVQFFIIIATLVTVADLLTLTQIAQFLRNVLNFIPNVFVGVVILGIGLVAGNVVGNIVERSTNASTTMGNMSGILSGLARWSIIIFALLTALIQVGVAASLIQIIFTGMVVALSLAIGLAFGLGGQDRAHDWLERLNRNIRMPKQG